MGSRRGNFLSDPQRGLILMHTGQADLYETDGILEETLVHGAAHTSLDPYAASPEWLASQVVDVRTTYASEFPDCEEHRGELSRLSGRLIYLRPYLRDRNLFRFGNAK